MTRSTTFPVITLVCSAGGPDAPHTRLTPLPVDRPAAILVLQHPSPERTTKLAMILDKTTALSVPAAEDGDRLETGRVPVAPPGQHTLITGGQTIALIASGDRPPYRPSADLLLTTLATAMQERAIAVVLSGQGNDAVTGATAVRSPARMHGHHAAPSPVAVNQRRRRRWFAKQLAKYDNPLRADTGSRWWRPGRLDHVPARVSKRR